MKKLLYVLFIANIATSFVAQAANPPPDNDLVHQLQKGGYVLYLRQCLSNQDQADTDPLHIENVAAQRQLSDEGHKQAIALGEAFRELDIPFGNIVSSLFNRSKETASLLGVGTPTFSLDISEGGLVVSPNENKRRAEVLRRLLSTPPGDGVNNLIVGHRANLEEAAGKDFGDVKEGETVVFQPTPDGKFRLIARVPATTWTKWRNDRDNQ